MNKVILMGRLTKEPEVRYSQGEKATAICRYTLAVNRSFKREGEPEADFINIVSFGKAGEFAGNYFKKGRQVAVVGSLRVTSFADKDGNKRWSTDVIASEQFFADSKKEEDGQQTKSAFPTAPAPSAPAQENYSQDSLGWQEYQTDEDLPF